MEFDELPEVKVFKRLLDKTRPERLNLMLNGSILENENKHLPTSKQTEKMLNDFLDKGNQC